MAMNIERFWSIIEDMRHKTELNVQERLNVLIDSLSQLPAESIQEFERILWLMMGRAYRADLWEAASLVAGGCTDDDFHEFRGWLIAQGQSIYEMVLDNPDNLSTFVDKEERYNIFNGGMTSVAEEAYERKTGQPIPEDEYGEKVVLGRPLRSENESIADYPRIVATLGIGKDD